MKGVTQSGCSVVPVIFDDKLRAGPCLDLPTQAGVSAPSLGAAFTVFSAKMVSSAEMTLPGCILTAGRR